MSSTQHLVLDVPDVSCEHCKMTIEKALQGRPGIEKAEVDVASKTLDLVFVPATITLDQVKDILEEEDYPVAGEHVVEG